MSKHKEYFASFGAEANENGTVSTRTALAGYGYTENGAEGRWFAYAGEVPQATAKLKEGLWVAGGKVSVEEFTEHARNEPTTVHARFHLALKGWVSTPDGATKGARTVQFVREKIHGVFHTDAARALSLAEGMLYLPPYPGTIGVASFWGEGFLVVGRRDAVWEFIHDLPPFWQHGRENTTPVWRDGFSGLSTKALYQTRGLDRARAMVYVVADDDGYPTLAFRNDRKDD